MDSPEIDVVVAPRVVLLESRMSRELARLVEKHGGEPVCVPAVRESHELVSKRPRASSPRSPVAITISPSS